MNFEETILSKVASWIVSFVFLLAKAFFVMLFLGWTSVPALHIGYWDAFFISAAIGTIFSWSAARTNSQS